MATANYAANKEQTDAILYWSFVDNLEHQLTSCKKFAIVALSDGSKLSYLVVKWSVAGHVQEWNSQQTESNKVNEMSE